MAAVGVEEFLVERLDGEGRGDVGEIFGSAVSGESGEADSGGAACLTRAENIGEAARSGFAALDGKRGGVEHALASGEGEPVSGTPG